MKQLSFVVAAFSLCAMQAKAAAITVDLGSAASFAVLAGSAVTNTGPTILQGDLGVWSGTAITGFPPGQVVGGTVEAGNASAAQAESDFMTGYNMAAGEACGQTLTGSNLGGLTLTSGVYCFASAAQLSGTLTLDAGGDPNAVFVFQIANALTTATGASVSLVDGAQGGNVFWQVGTSATLGDATAFTGSILALTSITLDTQADITCGRALARNGAVTLDSNDVITGTTSCATTSALTQIPEPGTASLLGTGVVLSVILSARRRWNRGAIVPRRFFRA